MKKSQDLPDCNVSTTIRVLSSKWKIYIIQILEKNPMQFSEFISAIDGISKNVLSQTLRSMVEDGIIEKKIFPEIPYPHIGYGLSHIGITLIPVLKEMEKWGHFYKNYIQYKK